MSERHAFSFSLSFMPKYVVSHTSFLFYFCSNTQNFYAFAYSDDVHSYFIHFFRIIIEALPSLYPISERVQKLPTHTQDTIRLTPFYYLWLYFVCRNLSGFSLLFYYDFLPSPPKATQYFCLSSVPSFVRVCVLLPNKTQ